MKNYLLWVFLFFTASAPLKALEIKRVILATNNDPKYIQFWPIVAPLWRAMGLEPTLALIAEEDCPIDTSLGSIIRFSPLPGIPESTHAQAIRLLLPVLFPEDVCILSDIDMLPISKSYFINNALSCPEDAFLVYRNCAYGCGYPRYPMCYVAAKGALFSSIFGAISSEDFPKIITHWVNEGLGWNTDELILYRMLNQWQSEGGSIVYLNHGVDSRLDRGDWPSDLRQLHIENYIDCHCPRPYAEYQSSIDEIAIAIKQLLLSMH